MIPCSTDGLPWVRVAPAAPYFITEDGVPWTPIGQNDAITWPDLSGLFARRDVAGVDRHLAWLAAHGITCLRVMLEYAQGEHRYLERPVGRFQPKMVQLWDDLFALCARHDLRLLLTPFDTFWMGRRWGRHPYNRTNGGPGTTRRDWLGQPAMIAAIKARLSFVIERWGGNGALFAWDLWNEMHPAQMRGDMGAFAAVVGDIGAHVRAHEERLFGRSHPQTVSLFGPVLHRHPEVADTIFRHPALDISTTHLYDPAVLDAPRNSVDPAIRVGEMVREAIAHAPPLRPYLDSEHGPMHVFNRRRRTLDEAFDDECFRHIQWAHLASGGAGGGLRWPYRHPHVLTHGMRRAQGSLAGFATLIDWAAFARRNLNHEVALSTPAFAAFACADARQGVVWLLRRDARIERRRRVDPAAPPLPVTLHLPGMEAGDRTVHLWDTGAGVLRGCLHARAGGGALSITLPVVVTDVALAIRCT